MKEQSEKDWQVWLFDKDGTLVDFSILWPVWAQEIRDELDPRDESDHFSQRLAEVWGMHLETGEFDPRGVLAVGSREETAAALWSVLVSEHREIYPSSRDLQTLLANKHHELRERGLVKPLPGVLECLETLARRGCTLAVVTADHTDAAWRDLEIAGLDGFFAQVLGCDQVPNCKPAPDLVHRVCASLGVGPGDAVVVGDSEGDMKMGRQAGAGWCVGVTSGVSPPEVLQPLADIVVPGVGDILRV